VLRYCHPSCIRQTLDRLPKTLDETYARVLSQIPEVNQALAHRLLQCLMVAVRPLRAEELAELLAFEFDTTDGSVPRYRADWRLNDQEAAVEAVLSTCSSLIAIVDNHGSQVVQFSHFSVKEFLVSDRLTSALGDFSQYRIFPGSAHTILAQVCLGFLLHLNDPVDEECIKDFPLAGYAAEYWVAHAQFEDVASQVKDGMESLFDLDKPHFSAWVGIYNIDKGPNVELPTPLYYSSLCGFSELVEQLATKHPQHVNAIGGRYEFPLLAALVRKHVGVAEILLEHGANVDIRGVGEQTPLHKTIRDGAIVQFLLNKGADVNCQKDDLCTPLHLAVRGGHLKVARVLLEHGANFDLTDNMGKTPLYLLFDGGGNQATQLAQYLLEYGADVNTRTMNGWTPLHKASFRGWIEISRILLDHGANVNAENQGETPLHLVSRRDYSYTQRGVDMAQLLLQHGIDIHAQDKNHDTALHSAAFRGRLEITQVLLNHDANPSTENDKYDSPLIHRLRGEYCIFPKNMLSVVLTFV
jgi:ankyrin repeat protein